MLRILSLGNRLKRDDAVAIKAAEYLSKNLEQKGIEVIIGDINYDYCFNILSEEDHLIILTAVYSRKVPGTIEICKISDVLDCYSKNICNSKKPYNTNIFELMNNYGLSYTGYIIKIYVADISFALGLSNDLKIKFEDICNKIESLITDINNSINVNK